MPRYLRIALGSILLVLGVAGLALPLLQGLLFIVLGILLLARDIPWFARLAEHFRARFPRISRTAERARGRLREKWTRVRPRRR